MRKSNKQYLQLECNKSPVFASRKLSTGIFSTKFSDPHGKQKWKYSYLRLYNTLLPDLLFNSSLFIEYIYNFHKFHVKKLHWQHVKLAELLLLKLNHITVLSRSCLYKHLKAIPALHTTERIILFFDSYFNIFPLSGFKFPLHFIASLVVYILQSVLWHNSQLEIQSILMW